MSSSENMSLYIPHVFANISKERIVKIFEILSLGKVRDVDFVSKMGNSGSYNSAYLHFDYWYDNVASQNFRERVKAENKEARIVYDDPWYWIVLQNKSKKIIPGQQKCLEVKTNEATPDQATILKSLMNQKEFIKIQMENEQFMDLEDENYDLRLEVNQLKLENIALTRQLQGIQGEPHNQDEISCLKNQISCLKDDFDETIKVRDLQIKILKEHVRLLEKECDSLEDKCFAELEAIERERNFVC